MVNILWKYPISINAVDMIVKNRDIFVSKMSFNRSKVSWNSSDSLFEVVIEYENGETVGILDLDYIDFIHTPNGYQVMVNDEIRFARAKVTE